MPQHYQRLHLLIIFLMGLTISAKTQNWDQIIKATASDRAAGDKFGYKVAISGDYAVVGALQEDEDVAGLNTVSDAGAAYIFKRIGTNWVQEAKIVASERASRDNFGAMVDIDGDYVVVGAPFEDQDASGLNTLGNAGAAYIFKRTGNTWAQEAIIVASDRTGGDYFGTNVAISGDYVIVGVIQDDEDAEGKNTLNSAGSAYIFKRTGTTWAQEAKIVASDRGADAFFGSSVAISGDYVIVGAKDENKDETGANSLLSAGAAYVFKRTGTTWAQEAKIVASDRTPFDFFGSSVAISGDYSIVGAFAVNFLDASGLNNLSFVGAAYIFKRTGTTWVQEAKVVASDKDADNYFGQSVTINGDYALVGAPNESEDATGANTKFLAGSVYIFKRTGTNWAQEAKIVNSDRGRFDNFGFSVALSDNYALIGAVGESEDASGANTQSQAGSIYFFKPASPCVSVTPSVVLTSNDADNSITSGTSVTFTATPTNGGATPTYVWSKNNVTINGVTNNTYTTTTLANGDKIKVEMTSSDACASPTSATSNEITICILPTAYSVTGGGVYCGGSTGVAVGLSNSEIGVSYQLKKDNINAGNAVAGTGTAISFGNQTVSGNYTVVATRNSGGCTATMTSIASVVLNAKPTIGLNVNGQGLVEGTASVLCDLDVNLVNSLQWVISTNCAVGSPVWRSQVGNGAWSDWLATPPVSQLSNNQVHRYQAACDANCLSTYTTPIALTINYRANTPQNVSLTADGTTIAAGESKTLCNIDGNIIAFNATCGAGELLYYSVDGGEYLTQLPTQLVDGIRHNYRVRCRRADGVPSCVETDSGVMGLTLNVAPPAAVVSLLPASNCGTPEALKSTTNCGGFNTIWYDATTELALPNLPTTTPTTTTAYFARCQSAAGCLGSKSNVVTFIASSSGVVPTVTASADLVCTGTEVSLSVNCPTGSSVLWNTGLSGATLKVAFSNVTRQSYSARCVTASGCQSALSEAKTVSWKAFELTIINIGQSKSAIKINDRAAWASQFVTADAGPILDKSTESNPTIYYSENVNKAGPRYWTIHVDACSLGESGSLTYDMLATPETGVVRSYNTHENNAPYFMYANRSGYTELYAQNHPVYGFYQDNGSGGNVYDEGLPKGLYKLVVRYWDMKGWGSIYPATRKPQGNVLALQEYWFRIQSKDGIGVGAARQATVNSQQFTVKGQFAEVAPNPVSSVMRLKVLDAKAQKVNVSLIDASGRTLLQRGFVPETNAHQEEFNVSEIANGMYFLKVNAGEKQATLKVIKVE